MVAYPGENLIRSRYIQPFYVRRLADLNSLAYSLQSVEVIIRVSMRMMIRFGIFVMDIGVVYDFNIITNIIYNISLYIHMVVI